MRCFCGVHFLAVLPILRALSLFGKLTLVLCLSLFPSSWTSFLRFQSICFYFIFVFVFIYSLSPIFSLYSAILFLRSFLLPLFCLSLFFYVFHFGLFWLLSHPCFLSLISSSISLHFLSLSICLPVFLQSFSFYFLLSHRSIQPCIIYYELRIPYRSMKLRLPETSTFDVGVCR